MVPRTELKCKCRLFGSSITLFQNIQQGICFDSEHYFQQMPFSHLQESFSQSSNCSLKGTVISPQKWCTDILKPRGGKATCSTYKLFTYCQSSSYLSNLQEGWFLLMTKPEYLIINLLINFQTGPFMFFSHENLTKVVTSISKCFHTNAYWRFCLALNSHLLLSWQDAGCDHTYHWTILSLVASLNYTVFIHWKKQH